MTMNIGQMPGGGKPLGRRHLLGGMAVAAVPVGIGLSATVDPDAGLIAVYDRFVAMSRTLNWSNPPSGMSEEERDRFCDALYEKYLEQLTALLNFAPSGPAGVAVLALAAIRQSGEMECQREFLHSWDGYSRPIDDVMDETNTILWNIAAWGLRQSRA